MVFFTNHYNFDMEETEQQIDCHAHNQHDQVAAIDRWLFVKQEEHDAISLAEAYFFKIAFMFEMFCIFNLLYSQNVSNQIVLKHSVQIIYPEKTLRWKLGQMHPSHPFRLSQCLLLLEEMLRRTLQHSRRNSLFPLLRKYLTCFYCHKFLGCLLL